MKRPVFGSHLTEQIVKRRRSFQPQEEQCKEVEQVSALEVALDPKGLMSRVVYSILTFVTILKIA